MRHHVSVQISALYLILLSRKYRSRKRVFPLQLCTYWPLIQPASWSLSGQTTDKQGRVHTKKPQRRFKAWKLDGKITDQQQDYHIWGFITFFSCCKHKTISNQASELIKLHPIKHSANSCNTHSVIQQIQGLTDQWVFCHFSRVNVDFAVKIHTELCQRPI